MSRRKPLPYVALACIDNAAMALTEAQRSVRKLLEKEHNRETLYYELARITDRLHQAQTHLAEAKSANQQNPKGE